MMTKFQNVIKDGFDRIAQPLVNNFCRPCCFAMSLSYKIGQVTVAYLGIVRQ